MKSKLLKTLSLAFAIAVCSSTALTGNAFAEQPANNLIVNGSFENRPDMPNTLYTPAIEGWNIIAAVPNAAYTPQLEVHHFPGTVGGDTYFANSADGQFSAELNSEKGKPVTIYQDIPTVPGKTYVVKFAMSSRNIGSSDLKAEIGTTDGTVQASYEYKKSANPGKWEYKSFTFTAQEGQTSTRFSLIPLNGATNSTANEIDDISVVESACSANN